MDKCFPLLAGALAVTARLIVKQKLQHSTTYPSSIQRRPEWSENSKVCGEVGLDPSVCWDEEMRELSEGCLFMPRAGSVMPSSVEEIFDCDAKRHHREDERAAAYNEKHKAPEK